MERKKYLVELMDIVYPDFIYKKLFEILNVENLVYTDNSNGIFIKINDISDSTIEESIKFIESINNSFSCYKEGESIRSTNLESMKNTIKNKKKTIVRPKRDKLKLKTVQTIKKIPLKGVYKRLVGCMGRNGHRKKLEMFEDDEDDETVRDVEDTRDDEEPEEPDEEDPDEEEPDDEIEDDYMEAKEGEEDDIVDSLKDLGLDDED